ncbi:MAG: LssY C-terminal domain-containing protein [Paracoccaceae bacterium]
MTFGLDQILPSLQSLGILGYWLIGLASLLEAFFLTGVVVPGTLVVDAGGILVQHGKLDFFDLIWFVAIGSIIGGEISYRIGRRGARHLKGRLDPQHSASFRRAVALFDRRGAVALVIGRFSGPVAGFVSLAAALSGMEYRRFARWNIVGAFPYAIAHVSLGYFLGDLLGKFGPLATRFAFFALAVLVVLGVLWFLIVRIRRALPFTLSVLTSTIEAIEANTEVQAWASRHPRITRLIVGRIDRARFIGLPATALGALFLYLLGVWLESAIEFVSAGPIVRIDQNLATLIHAFWDPRLLRVAAHLTALGDWRTVTILVAGTLAVLTIARQWPLVVGLLVSVVGNVLSVPIFKAAFERPRPELAYFAETSGSFPSGHAAISIAFYGFLFFILWRVRLLRPVSAMIVATTIAFLIGLSRIYLIEHYLSDVLNGYLIGSLWLVAGVAVTEWRSDIAAQSGLPDRSRQHSALILAVPPIMALIGAVWIVTTYDKARNVIDLTNRIETVTDVVALFTDGTIPVTTETIAGDPQEPVNLAIAAPDFATFETALSDAGWTKAAAPSLVSLTRAALAAWTNRQDTNAPVTPYFWMGQPNDFAFEKSTPDNTLRKRHHVRFWRSRFRSPAGAEWIFATASFDDGLDWGITHHVDPNIDAQRDLLTQDIQRIGKVQSTQLTPVSAAQMGRNFNGDPWFTDGKISIVYLMP